VQCGFSVTFPQAIARGDLDLALFADSDKNQWSDAVFSEKLVWAASRNYQSDRREPVPLAVFDRACEWRDIATDALKAVKTPCRIVLSSESVTGIMASISTGLAVGVIAESTLQPGMKILDHRDGFPGLPNSVLRLLKGTKQSPAIKAMEDAITRGFGHSATKPT
ncbi:MAG: LysR substrate-binding domain-containing protein, partial [Pseudomonadota bacterium]